jgi:hypothetical protein
MLAPKWAHEPLSGAGAATRGGRHNEAGMPALYMSGQFATAVAEYEQDLGIRPGTLCAYDADVTGVLIFAIPRSVKPRRSTRVTYAVRGSRLRSSPKAARQPGTSPGGCSTPEHPAFACRRCRRWRALIWCFGGGTTRLTGRSSHWTRSGIFHGIRVRGRNELMAKAHPLAVEAMTGQRTCCQPPLRNQGFPSGARSLQLNPIVDLPAAIV